MQVTINGEPPADLPENWQKDIVLGWERPEISSSVIDTDAAMDKFLVRYRIICAGFVIFTWLVCYGLVAAAQRGEPFLRTFGIILAVVMPFVFMGAYFLRKKGLLQSLPERARASPPPGTAIRVDPSGLTVGDHFAAWNDVIVDKVDFEVMSRRYGRDYLVHQVSVRTKDFSCVLDGLLIDEGAAILNEIYRNKYRGVGRRI